MSNALSMKTRRTKAREPEVITKQDRRVSQCGRCGSVAVSYIALCSRCDVAASLQATLEEVLTQRDYYAVELQKVQELCDSRTDALEERTRERDEAQQQIAEAREACPIVRRQNYFEASLLTAVNETVSQLFQMQSQRDKWLEAFNELEQFQSGPTKRAEAAEATYAKEEEAKQLAHVRISCDAWQAKAEAAEATLTAAQEAMRTVCETFTRDEAQGYRSKDRQFAIEILEAALGSSPGTKELK